MKVILTKFTRAGTVRTLQEYCHTELVNVGSSPTTIMNISATHSKGSGNFQLGMSSQSFTEHYDEKLPIVLSPGEVWSCRLGMDRYFQLMEYGKPEIHIHLSHLKSPLIARATKKQDKGAKVERS